MVEYVVFGVFFMLLVGIFIFVIYREKRIKSYVSYEKGTLTLKSRNGYIRKAVKIVADTNDYLAKTPKKLLYTSATVGGITTGGLDTIGGDIVEVKGPANGKYKLIFRDCLITKIELTDELYSEALNSSIKEYLDPNKKMIIVNQRLDSSLLNQPIGLTVELQQILVQRINSSVLPNYQKAKAIYDWICNV